MRKHYTPKHLISKLKRHLPKKANRLLEPSVGDGALLDVIRNNINAATIKTTVFDINAEPLKEIRNRFNCVFSRLTLRNECFLNWSTACNSRKLFDLIVMNPPFSGRSETWVEFEKKKMPIEIAFLRSCMNLCSENGTIMAILPKTIISGDAKSSLEVREALFSSFSVKYCYELNEFEFPTIEGQFYLLVAKKQKLSSRVHLRNSEDGEVVLSSSKLRCYGYRLDYSFIKSLRFYEMITNNDYYHFKPAGVICDIYRGKLIPPYDKHAVIHSTSYSGHWNNPSKTIFNKQINSVYVDKGDILVKRVGRNCLKSFGLMLINRKQVPTDCILILRPKNQDDAMKILFSIRILYSHSNGESYLQRGTGAKYISANRLALAPILTNLHKIYDSHFRQYEIAVKSNHIEEMMDIESVVRESISNFLYGSQKTINPSEINYMG
ncbi:Modification methylase Eco57IB [Thalassocella blandensis]|nr:Modification methylase Eco57IB [Thalassocella blandensis]